MAPFYCLGPMVCGLLVRLLQGLTVWKMKGENTMPSSSVVPCEFFGNLTVLKRMLKSV